MFTSSPARQAWSTGGCRKVCFNAFHSLSTTTTAPSLLDVLLQRCSHKYSSLTIKMTLLIIFSASLAHLPPEAPLESCHKHFIVTLHILHSTSFSHLLSFHCAFNLIPSCYKVLSLGTQVEPSNQGWTTIPWSHHHHQDTFNLFLRFNWEKLISQLLVK